MKIDKPIVAPRTPTGDQFAAGFRQLLLILGGYFVSTGSISSDELEIIVGAAVIIGSLVYGQFKTRQRSAQVSTLTSYVPDAVAQFKARRGD